MLILTVYVPMLVTLVSDRWVLGEGLCFVTGSTFLSIKKIKMDLRNAQLFDSPVYRGWKYT